MLPQLLNQLRRYVVLCWEKQMRKFWVPKLVRFMFHVELCRVEKYDNILIRAFSHTRTPADELKLQREIIISDVGKRDSR